VVVNSNSPEGRVFFRDVKPYEAPDSLEQLRGPAGGVVGLSHSVFWAPGGGRVDLDVPGGRAMAYQALICEGTAEEQALVLNRGWLITVWGELMLPPRVRDLWEGRFPELRDVEVA
jgi:hypothetical protein